jgi:hypothetical protein
MISEPVKWNYQLNLVFSLSTHFAKDNLWNSGTCGLCVFLEFCNFMESFVNLEVLPSTNYIIWMLSGLLGSVAPCVLYGSNVERLAAGQSTFANSCLPYTGLFMLGNSLFGWNCLAPWFSHPTRTAIRRRYNLEASVSICPVSVSFSICRCTVSICNWDLYVLWVESSNFT